MRLLVIAPASAPDRSGLSLRVFNWVQMVKSQAEVIFLSTDQQKNPENVHRFYFSPVADSWISKTKKIWNYYKTDFSKPALAEKPDIVQIHTPYFFGFKKFFPGIPVVLVEHDVNWNLLQYDMASGPGLRKLPIQFPLIPWLQWRAKQFEKKCLKEAAHIFVCSPVDQKEIAGALPELSEKMTVIPNCLDLSRYTPSGKLGESVLFMGSMTYSANLDAIDTICQKLAPKMPHIPFQILGSGNYAKPHPENVRFSGHVEDVKPYLADCRLFIAPLRYGSGTRWKILEAMAMERPVLSTPKGAEGLEVTSGKEIWIEEEWEAFIQAIKTLWDNRELAGAMAQRGRKLIESRYDFRNYSAQVLNVYRRLLQRNLS